MCPGAALGPATEQPAISRCGNPITVRRHYYRASPAALAEPQREQPGSRAALDGRRAAALLGPVRREAFFGSGNCGRDPFGSFLHGLLRLYNYTRARPPDDIIGRDH